MNQAITRREDWAAALVEFIESRRTQPFVWGANDCCLGAADWVLTATRVDVAAQFRGRYSTALGAMLCAKRAGIATDDDPFGVCGWPDIVGLPEINRKAAQRGDIVAFRQFGGPLALGVMVGNRAIGFGANGIEFVHTADVVRAWRI